MIGSQLLAALPIREQPTYPPETAITLGDAIFLGLLGALLLVIATAIVTRRFVGRTHRLAVEEQRVRALMEELCPNGWRARLTLYGRGAPTPEEAPDLDEASVQADQAPVQVEWAELDGDSAEPLVTRRLWSRTVSGALRAMIADRRLDAQLEEIERTAARSEPGSEDR